MALSGWQDDLKRSLGVTVGYQSSPRGIDITIPCECGPKPLHFDKRLPVEIVRKKLQQKGWTLGKKPTCPDCSTKQREHKPMTTKEPTPDAKRVHRAVMEALMIAYDEDKKAYTGGYTDQKVATETGAAIEYVRKTREDYFGPLAEPSELAEIRRDIENIAAQVNKGKDDMAKITSNLADAIDGVRNRLDSIAKRNGWA